MSRIPELRPDTMSPAQKAVADEIVSGPHARIIGPYNAWLQSPELARRARILSEFIRFKSSLPQRFSEIAILIAGRYWKAEFEYYAHSALARKAGVEDEIISAIAAKRRPAFKNADDAVVYDMCMELFENRRVSQATYDKAVKALGVPAVVEMVATAGYYCMVSLTLNAFEVPLPPGEKSPFPDK